MKNTKNKIKCCLESKIDHSEAPKLATDRLLMVGSVFGKNEIVCGYCYLTFVHLITEPKAGSWEDRDKAMQDKRRRYSQHASVLKELDENQLNELRRYASGRIDCVELDPSYNIPRPPDIDRLIAERRLRGRFIRRDGKVNL